MHAWDRISLEVNRNANLFRFISIGRLIELVTSNKLVFVRPKLWDDPFENFLMYTRLYSMQFSDADIQGHTRALYCQCWTSKPESDAMWRIYSRSGYGVRLKAKASDLMDSITTCAYSSDRAVHFWIGRVKYISEKSLLDKVEWPDRFCTPDDFLDPSNLQLVRSLLLKRKAFSHEKEVRIVYHDVNAKKAEDFVSFAIDTNEVIREITFDPRMPPELVDSYTIALVKLGYEGTVNQSRLYGQPAFQPIFSIFWDQLAETARNKTQ